MRDMSVPYERMTASRYAGRLRKAVRSEEPGRLLDMLLVGALIEARSCERFAMLVPELPEQLGRFYAGLLESEARHFEHYLALAREECDVSGQEFKQRLAEIRELEARLISEPDTEFHFHSGKPIPP